jgi:hypothetical protein
MSRRHRWISLAAPVVLAAFAPAAIGTASAAKVTNVKSTVTIKSGEGSKFTGKVSSAQKACTRGRKVKLFMEPYSGGRDELVGTTKTKSSGIWELKGSFMAGIYHAEVTSSFVHTDSATLNCRFDISVSAKY